MIAVTTLLVVLFAYPVISSGELIRRQDLSGVPACGQTCLITAATNPALVGSCSLTDVSCLCKNDKFQSSVTSCALSACSTQDQAKMLTWASATCPETTSTTAEPAPSIPSADASELGGLPACGQNCVVDTSTDSAIVGSCSPTDVACLCSNSKYMGAVTQCVASKCSLSEESKMLTWSTTTCPAGGASTGSTPSVAMGATSSLAAPPTTSQLPSATVSASQSLRTANSTPGVADVQTGLFNDTTTSTSGLLGVVQANATNSSILQTCTNVTNSSRSGVLQAASMNLTTSNTSLTSTAPFQMPTATSASASVQTSASLPATYKPYPSSASTVFRNAPSFWVLAAVLVPATLWWQ